ncbi:hypothetical protein TIFTF001_006223 [Ficus carica]|uniref:Uncharacterized protein n=1 Tax=Ficus carica TaxID=3494 RepID=A0AA87ZQL9_FICCA|nr:hypothetical protein TIFTF001_006223 [Ficus carica]
MHTNEREKKERENPGVHSPHKSHAWVGEQKVFDRVRNACLGLASETTNKREGAQSHHPHHWGCSQRQRTRHVADMQISGSQRSRGRASEYTWG